MFPKDIWCLLFRDYFDCKTVIICYRAAKSIRYFMTLGQIQTCERYAVFKKTQKQLILKKTNKLQFGLCSICGSLQNWNNLSKHQRSCKELPNNLRADHCEKCETPLPYVTGLAHKPYNQVLCPFDEIQCLYCRKIVLRIEMESHEKCNGKCRLCGKIVPARSSQNDHDCSKQCGAIIKKKVQSKRSFRLITEIVTKKCSRACIPNSKYCFQHAKKNNNFS